MWGRVMGRHQRPLVESPLGRLRRIVNAERASSHRAPDVFTQDRMSGLDVADRVTHPPRYCLACAFRGIKRQPRSAAQAHRRSQVSEQELALSACLTSSLRIVVGLCVEDILLELQQTRTILGTRFPVEYLPGMSLTPKTALRIQRRVYACARIGATRQMYCRHFATRRRE